MKYDSKCSKPLLNVYKGIVDALPMKKKGKLIGKTADAFNSLSYYSSMGFPPAMVYLGKLYANGVYVRKNIKYALDLFKKAAKCGYPLGYREIAQLIFNNEAKFPNQKNIAIRCYTKAFYMGDYKAGVELAKQFINDEDSEYFDNKLAFNYLTTAWEKGHCISAKVQLALCYVDGISVEKDVEKGEKMFKELISKHKSDEAAIVWLKYVNGCFSYPSQKIKSFIKLIETSIPEIRTNAEYVTLKRRVNYYV